MNSNNTPTNRNERRRLETRGKIRKAAIECFSAAGFVNVTVQDIMEKADLGYGTFYQYYSSKQDILLELAGEAANMIKNEYRFPPVTETSLYRRAIFRLGAHYQTYAKHRDVINILRDCHTTDQELHAAWIRLTEELSTRLNADLTWCMERGLCRDVAPATALLAMNGMVSAIADHIVQSNPTEEEIEGIVRDVGSLFVNAIFAVEEIPPHFLRRTGK